MSEIVLTGVQLSEPSADNQMASIEYKITGQPDSTYVLWRDDAVVLTDGSFNPPITITGLSDFVDYTVRITLYCSVIEQPFLFDFDAPEPCVPPDTEPDQFIYSYTESGTETIFSQTDVQTACNAASYMLVNTTTENTYTVYYLSLEVGELVYSSNTICEFVPDGNYVVDLDSSLKIVSIANGIITEINTCVINNLCDDCSPAMVVTSSNVSNISAGVVTSSTCTVGDYVIDWYTGSTYQFSSGSTGTVDNSVTAVHPFTNELIQGGTVHPRIKFIYLNGIKYSSVVDGVSAYSPDLKNCLPTIVVQAYGCAGGVAGKYSHAVIYTYTGSNSASATRTIRFDIDSGNPYFAWYFQGYSVYDTINITYVSPTLGTETVLEYWVVGQDAPSTNLLAYPKTNRIPYMSKITKLLTYNTGDYLKINITPNPTNSNTNWRLDMKCLPSIDCNIASDDIREIVPNSVVMSWNSTNCAWELKYDRYINDPWNSQNSIIYNYQQFSNFIYGNNPIWNSPAYFNVTLALPDKIQTTMYNTHSSSSCTNLSGTSYWTKTGTELKCVFDNINDYNLYKANYNAVITNTGMTNWNPDDTNIDYYKFYLLQVLIGESCGDTVVQKSFYTHITNPIIFDDNLMTLTATLELVTNNLSDANCNNSFSVLNPFLGGFNNSNNVADFSSSSKIKMGNVSVPATSAINGYFLKTTVNKQTTMESGLQERYTDLTVCDYESLGWNNVAGYAGLYVYYDYFKITDQADPANNYELSRKVNRINGQLITNIANYILIYKVVAGVVTVNRIAEYNSGALDVP